MDIRRLVHRIAEALGPEADPAQIEALAAAVLDVATQPPDRPPPSLAETEPFALRTITLGVSLFDCSSPLPQTVRARVYDKIRRTAAYHATTVEDIAKAAGVHVGHTSVAVTPMALVAGSLARDELIGLAQLLDTAAQHVGVDTLCGFSALVDQGLTEGARSLIAALPTALTTTTCLCGSMTCGSPTAGINAEAVRHAAEVISETARLTSTSYPAGGTRFAALYHATPPAFSPGAFHAPGTAEAAITVGISGTEILRYGLRNVKAGADLEQVRDAITQAAFTITCASARIGRACAERLDQRTGPPVSFGGLSLGLSPSPHECDILGHRLTTLGVESVGASGTAALLTLLLDAVQQGARLAHERVGMVHGPCLPVASSNPHMNAFSATAGLDVVPLPGDTSPETIAGLLFDAFSTHRQAHATTACRFIPVSGKQAGDSVALGEELGAMPIMPVTPSSHLRLA